MHCITLHGWNDQVYNATSSACGVICGGSAFHRRASRGMCRVLDPPPPKKRKMFLLQPLICSEFGETTQLILEQDNIALDVYNKLPQLHHICHISAEMQNFHS